ncbi:MAG: hypothetical protein Q9161_003183 [Pseudevernia consocians]
MKSSIATSLALLFGAVNALPQSELEKRATDPIMVPVTFNQLPTTTFTCGSNHYSNQDVYLAAQYGVLLKDSVPPQYRGKKSNLYPNGRFPHAFTSNPNGQSLSFLPNCPDDDDDRQEYPLIANGPYNGGISNNNKWGNDRVVYVFEEGEIDNDGHPLATFCGVMTHSGASDSSSFVLCTSP